MSAPEPRLRPRVALRDWAARAAILLSGIALFSLIRPVFEPTEAPSIGEQGESYGRGAPSTPPSAQARAAGYETREMSGGTMAALVIGLGASVAVIIGIVSLLLAYLDSARQANEPRFTAQQTARIVPPAPNLQAAPALEIATLRAREDSQLSHYVFIDAARTRARIPIERAMALTVGHTLDAIP